MNDEGPDFDGDVDEALNSTEGFGFNDEPVESSNPLFDAMCKHGKPLSLSAAHVNGAFNYLKGYMVCSVLSTGSLNVNRHALLGAIAFDGNMFNTLLTNDERKDYERLATTALSKLQKITAKPNNQLKIEAVLRNY